VEREVLTSLSTKFKAS